MPSQPIVRCRRGVADNYLAPVCITSGIRARLAVCYGLVQELGAGQARFTLAMTGVSLVPRDRTSLAMLFACR